MKQNLVIKQATIADLEELAELFNAYRMFYKQSSDVAGARHFLLERLERQESIIFVAIEAEQHKIIGFTQLYPSFSSISMQRSFILNDLYVEESFRKLGVGKKLLEAAEHYTKQMKAKGIELTTGKENITAQRLYENYGYEKIKEYEYYYLTI